MANSLSERRWQQYCDAARARGVKLTLSEIEPPSVPDEQNFASLPIWRAIFDGSAPKPLELPRKGGSLPRFGNPVKSEPMDWSAWQKLFLDAGFITSVSDVPARDILQGLDHYAPLLQQWSEWQTRPLCRFPLDYKAAMAMPLPHLGTFQDAAKLFTLRMRAHLMLGDSASAYADLREGLQACRKLEREPTFISGLVQISVLAVLWNGVGQGLMSHQWGEPELRQMGAEFAAVNPLNDRQRCLASERAFFNSIYDQLANASPMGRARVTGGLVAIGGGAAPPILGLGALIPKRVFRDNQLRHNQYLDELLAQVDKAGFHGARPTPSGPENLHLGGRFSPYYYFLFRIAAPVYSSALERYLHTQTKLDLTRLAIALERCHLARGTFPQTLAELAPEWIPSIPLDAASRQPLKYYRRDDGKSYLLYGVGKNQIDDGGSAIDPTKNEAGQKDDGWLYAPTVTAAPGSLRPAP